MGVAHLSGLTLATDVGDAARLIFEPTRKGAISWNTFESGTIAFRLLRAREPAGSWLDLARWHVGGSTSISPSHEGVRVDVDELVADLPFDGLDIRTDGMHLNLLAFASAVPARASLPYARDALILDVPRIAQYGAHGERGWCSPAALAMLLAYHGLPTPIETVAAAVFDRAYNGTGNWSFNTAYAGSLGLRAVVVYLQDLDAAQRLIERNLPLAISYSWSDGELPGAPLPRSDGHLAVLAGFTGNGDCAINDPAAANVRVVYPRRTLEQLWQRAGGVAYLLAPVGVAFADAL